ncbi:MAG: hypothetical protein KGJ70_03180 [Gemmatimonadota bacterium]|nr:hypothetical protein [Gemmatimonadota bacterium]
MRAARLYVPMVGIPLIGVLLVLRAGEKLAAAPAIHGTWRVRSMSAPTTGAAARCLAGITADSMHTLVVSQSGPDATISVRSADASEWASASVTIRGSSAAGTLDGAAPATPAAASAQCPGGATLTLQLPPRPVADTLLGSLADPTCAGCATLTFVATRRARPR